MDFMRTPQCVGARHTRRKRRVAGPVSFPRPAQFGVEFRERLVLTPLRNSPATPALRRLAAARTLQLRLIPSEQSAKISG